MQNKSTPYRREISQTSLLIRRFQQYYPLEYVMPCSSGTAALHIAVTVAGVGPGDEVITSPLTDNMGVLAAILYQQGVPIFADVEPHGYNIDVEDVARKISPKTKAIIAGHFGGNPCSLTALRKLADDYNLVLIEDCAQAWGAMHGASPVGTIGHIGCWRLNDFKQVAYGGGGLIASSDGKFGPHVKSFETLLCGQVSGRLPYYKSMAPNYLLNEPHAALAAVQITQMCETMEARAGFGQALSEHLRAIDGISPRTVKNNDRCAFAFYMFRTCSRKLSCSNEEFVATLQAEGVPCSTGYIRSPLYSFAFQRKQDFSNKRCSIGKHETVVADDLSNSSSQAEAILKSAVRIDLDDSTNIYNAESIAATIEKAVSHYTKNALSY